jgi:hypothetical protein
LAPSENGVVEVPISKLENYSNVVVVACDKYSVAQRMVDTTALLKTTNVPEIGMRDLTVNKEV